MISSKGHLIGHQPSLHSQQPSLPAAGTISSLSLLGPASLSQHCFRLFRLFRNYRDDGIWGSRLLFFGRGRNVIIEVSIAVAYVVGVW